MIEFISLQGNIFHINEKGEYNRISVSHAPDSPVATETDSGEEPFSNWTYDLFPVTHARYFYPNCYFLWLNVDKQYRKELQYVKDYVPRPLNDDDVLCFTTLDDPFVATRKRHSCIACDEQGKAQAMSLCCQRYNCVDCYSYWLRNEDVQCLSCHMNWAMFQISEVLLSPPEQEELQWGSELKKKFQSQWKELVIQKNAVTVSKN